MNATVERIGELMERGVSAGTTLLDAGASLLESLNVSPAVPKLTSCSCEIPPPCWMPKELRPVTCILLFASTLTSSSNVTATTSA